MLEKIKSKALLVKPSKTELAKYSKNHETLESLFKDAYLGVRYWIAKNQIVR